MPPILDRRMSRLEASMAPPLRPGLMLLMEVGETREQTLHRLYGPDGPPPTETANRLVFFVQPVPPPPAGWDGPDGDADE